MEFGSISPHPPPLFFPCHCNHAIFFALSTPTIIPFFYTVVANIRFQLPAVQQLLGRSAQSAGYRGGVTTPPGTCLISLSAVIKSDRLDRWRQERSQQAIRHRHPLFVGFQVGDLSNPELRIFTEQLDKISYGGESQSNLIP